jgi:hypothetical protein
MYCFGSGLSEARNVRRLWFLRLINAAVKVMEIELCIDALLLFLHPLVTESESLIVSGLFHSRC